MSSRASTTTILLAAVAAAARLAAPCPLAAQEPTVLSTLGLEPVVWERWEAGVADKREWLARSGIPLPPAYPTRAEYILPHFHSVDVDADGRADIVYSGPAWCSWESPPCDGTQTFVYRNAGTGLVRAFGAEGSIAALIRPAPQQALHLVFRPWASPECAGPGLYPVSLVFLRPSTRPDPAVFRREDVAYYAGTQWPRGRLPSPLRVRVTQDQYNLRWSPAVDDITRGESCEWTWRGNVLARFGRGATAVALAELRDGARTWYFVVTDSASAFTSPHPDVRRGTRLLGWMSARYLETIPAAAPWMPGAPPGRGTSVP